MRYPGGKGQAGVYQRLISLMPPHDVYIETHAGGANLFERKKPAAASFLVDLDPGTCQALQERHGRRCAIVNVDAVAFLRAFDFAGRRVLIYVDPPYVAATLKSAPRYRFNYSDEQHHALLSVLRELPAAVMLSGYRCPMYDAALAGWRRMDYETITRGGVMALESCWFNFAPPAQLHDSRYVGDSYRDRWRMAKKRRRWRAMLERMPAYERAAMLELLLELAAPGAAVGPGAAAEDREASSAGDGAAYRRAAPRPALADVMADHPGGAL